MKALGRRKCTAHDRTKRVLRSLASPKCLVISSQIGSLEYRHYPWLGRAAGMIPGTGSTFTPRDQCALHLPAVPTATFDTNENQLIPHFSLQEVSLLSCCCQASNVEECHFNQSTTFMSICPQISSNMSLRSIVKKYH